MTQEEFIKILDKKGYSYKIEGDRIVVTYEGNVDLESLTSLPPSVVFKNGGAVDLEGPTSLPPGVVFKNRGNVYLSSLTSISPGVKFENEGNEGDVYLKALEDWFNDWKGNIEGIDEKRLLNKMIKDGVFER
jgi:hypothetical protein